MKDKTVVITGGAGFIGSHLAFELARNNRVIIIDDLSSGRLENIAGLTASKNVKFIQDSILKVHLLADVCHGADFVFHLAAIASVQLSTNSPLVTNQVNVTGTLNVLTAALNGKVKKVILASSSAVYGNASALPNVEHTSPDPQSPYAVTKLAGEYYCRVFTQIYHLPTICLRYFNIYGPRQNPDSQYAAVIPVFIKRLSEDSPPVIYGDGSQTRDFTFVGDAVQANIRAAESDETGVFNIGTGKSTSIAVLADTIGRIMGKDLQPVHEERRVGEVTDSVADISRAASLGYEPLYSLETGLRETIGEVLHPALPCRIAPHSKREHTEIRGHGKSVEEATR